jgi:hypothetical protein
MGTEKEQTAVSNHPSRPAGAKPELTASRRQALARLGLVAAVAYSAPTILHLDRAAKANVEPSCTPPPGQPSCDPPLTFDGGEGAPAPE